MLFRKRTLLTFGLVIAGVFWASFLLAHTKLSSVLWFERALVFSCLIVSCKWCLLYQDGFAKWCIMWGALGASLLAADFGMTLFNTFRLANNNKHALRAYQLGRAFDVRSKERLLAELNAGTTEVPMYFDTAIFPERIVGKPLQSQGGQFYAISGIPEVEMIGENEDGYYPRYRHDRFGFHNPDFTWDDVTDVDFVLIGDSFTYNATVNTTISDILRKANHAVINLGFVGNGPMLEYAALKEAARYVKAKKYIWLYCEGNDLIDIEREKTVGILDRYLKEIDFTQAYFKRFHEEGFDKPLKDLGIKDVRARIGQGLFLSLLSQALQQENFLLDLIRIQNIRRALRQVLGVSLMNLDMSRFDEVLRKARLEVQTTGSELVFVYLPSFQRFDSGDIEHVRFGSTYRNMEQERLHILAMARSFGMTVIDITEIFMDIGDPKQFFPMRMHGHYTEEGYKIVANAILDRVR